MTQPKTLEDAKDKARTESKQPIKRPDFGGTLTLNGIKKNTKKK